MTACRAVTQVTDPFGRVGSLTYDATSGKISSFQDPFGRITTYSVNSAGNLVQITSPELCIYSIVYDGLNRPIASINPLGDRTSYNFDSSSRVISVQSPLGQLTSLSYGTNQTLITNPLGYVTTLNFTSIGSIQSVSDPVGHRPVMRGTHTIASRESPTGWETPRRSLTSVAATGSGALQAVTQPQGGIFTYSYLSGDVSGLIARPPGAASARSGPRPDQGPRRLPDRPAHQFDRPHVGRFPSRRRGRRAVKHHDILV